MKDWHRRLSGVGLLCLGLNGALTLGESVTIPFSSPEDLAGWESEYETWIVSDGVLTQSPAVTAGKRSVLWWPTTQYRDLDLSIEFRVLPDNLHGAGLGILYRAKSPREYLCASIDPRPNRKSVGLYHSLPNRAVNKPVVARKVDLKIEQWHTARVVARGPKQELYLNGQLLVTSHNDTYTEGVIGLRVSFAPTQFRNLKISGAPVPLERAFSVPSLPFVTVAHDAGAGRYEGFPDVCSTATGDLVCVFYAGFKHVPSGPNERLPKGGKIAMARSRDGGRTWSKPRTILDTDADDHDPQITRLASGRLVVTICCWPVRETHKPFIMWSDDDGHTWSHAKELEPPVARTEVPQGPIVEFPTGELLMPTYGSPFKDTPASVALVRISRDGGKTWPWSQQRVLRSPYESKRDRNVYEPCMARLPDGRLLMLARQKMFRWESTDNGQTWRPLDPMPFRGDSPNLLLTSKNILLCGIRFRGMGKTGRNRGTCVAYSKDFGKSWSEPVRIAPVIGGYTGMAELPDGKIFIVYYTEGRDSDIRGAWLSVDENALSVCPIPEATARDRAP